MLSKKRIGIIITFIGAVIIMVRALFLRSTEYALILQIIGIILFFGGGLLIPDYTDNNKQKESNHS
jgi:FtsH-binding integral membrane protein